jgi:hypothetical protein
MKWIAMGKRLRASLCLCKPDIAIGSCFGLADKDGERKSFCLVQEAIHFDESLGHPAPDISQGE